MSIQFQRQIRQNMTEIKDYLKDLYDWEEKIDTKKKKQKPKYDYPIRKLEIQDENECAENIQKFRKNKTTIGNYYNAWDKLDVEKEIEKIDKRLPKDIFKKKKEENKFRELLLDPKIKKNQADKLFLEKKYKKSEFIYKEILDLIFKIDKDIFSDNKKNEIEIFQMKIMGNLSQNYLNNKKYKESKKICLELLEKDENFLKNYFRLGKIFEMEKKYNKSIEYYNKGLLKSNNNLEKDEFLKKIRIIKKKIKVNLDVFKKSMEIEKYQFFGKRYFCDIKEINSENQNVKKEKIIIKREKLNLANKEEIEKEFNKYFKENKTENKSYEFLKLKNIEGKFIKKKIRNLKKKKFSKIKFQL